MDTPTPQMTPAPDRDARDILDRVHALGDLIDTAADAHEAASELTPEVLDALEQADVFKIMAPRVLGGYEAHPLQVMEVLRALSYLDGSTGWYCQAATTGVANLFDAAERGSIGGDLASDGRLCASHIIATGARVAQLAFTSSATTGLRNGSKIQRCFRDLQAGNAHFMTGEQSFIAAGRYLAGLPDATPGL